ncbi:hypothetical protein Rsub_06005 [Raphidocelis subcapitata]|uniref:TsaA-like domain-containing protein n=1 Tax=Raphidocelis subcapitata TaxID=307507 RepID=A0A2V0P5Y2_9CHLO|nr:hypothetical protein Rsub_06005 [Raphidocelis subcapitata]|eukprot:GBF93273.1 hypothetical protein Rsub_06005 [Raphidocelis subcapitata]
MVSKELATIFASAAGAGALAYAARWAQQLSARAAAAEGALAAAQAALQHEKENRAMERRGRTNAEKQLRYVRMQLAAAEAPVAAAGADANGAAAGPAAADGRAEGGAADAAAAAGPDCAGDEEQDCLGAAASSVAGVRGAHPPISVFPFRPIGYLQTCFSTRNGTPRQPLLVPSARSVLRLAPYVPADCLEGLQQYSHCWVLYIFHANTNMPRVIANATSARGVGAPAPTSFKAKIQVPRLNGGKMGVLATRTPHRPAPIGLSVAKVLGVEGNRLILGGADIVDGSPVLDIKPYVPFCDSLPGAVAPPWVQVEAADEPLKLSNVVVPPAVEAQVDAVWRAQRRGSVYDSSADALTLIKEV